MQNLKQYFNKKSIRYFSYFLLTAFMISLLWAVGQFFNINQFLEMTELKTLDFRYSMPHKAIKPNPNVVILTVDDTSLELLEEEFGRWPWSRDIYTQAVNYLESGKVDSIGFDLMFLGYQKGFEDKDVELAKTISRYKNVYASMNFDTRETENPPVLPDSFKVNLENQSSSIDFSNLTYTNCRLILKEIIESTPNIGIINLARDKDGISRRSPIFLKYQGGYYPYLAFKMAYNYLHKRENVNIDKFVINKDNQVILGKRKIQLGDDGKMLVNWYGPDHTFKYIPFWQVIKSIHAVKDGRSPMIPASYFKDKIVFIGVTGTSLYDIKSVPTSSIYPGVEVQASIFNNVVDGTPVTKANGLINLAICIILSLFTGYSVLKLRSTLASSFLTVTMGVLYVIAASMLLQKYFIWVELVNPIIIITLTFTFMYIIKYIMKSRDFEYTYKLATTDGLTNLHNHRYFQEHLANSIERAKRYRTHFSLLIIDIDFFKKFNDTYGHQAGDAVLRQVADTLKRTVRSVDFVARYGGEEMAIVLDNADIEEAVSIAQKVCKNVAEKPFKLSETVERHVTISLGVSTFPQHGQTPAMLIEFADQGLYRAKENGRNQVGSIPEQPTFVDTPKS